MIPKYYVVPQTKSAKRLISSVSMPAPAPGPGPEPGTGPATVTGNETVVTEKHAATSAPHKSNNEVAVWSVAWS